MPTTARFLTCARITGLDLVAGLLNLVARLVPLVLTNRGTARSAGLATLHLFLHIDRLTRIALRFARIAAGITLGLAGIAAWITRIAFGLTRITLHVVGLATGFGLAERRDVSLVIEAARLIARLSARLLGFARITAGFARIAGFAA